MYSNRPGAHEVGSELASPNVIIVDDEAMLAHALAARLSVDGIAATVATDASRGLALCGSRRFDAAFIDLKLPDGDGATLASVFKKRDPRTFVVLMTGFASSADDPVFENASVDTILPKPWRPGELKAIVQTILRKAE